MNKSLAKPGNVTDALAANRLGVPSVIFFVMSAATPLTVVAGVVTTGFATTGLTGIPFAFIVIGVLLALFSVGFVTMAPYVANAGAFYAYISRGLGRPLGVGGAWVALVAYNCLQVGLYGALGAASTPILKGWFGIDVSWWIVALVAWLVVAILGLQHVDVNGRVLAVLLAVEVAVIVIFAVSDVAHPAGGSVSMTTLSPGNLFGPGVGAVLAIAVLGFIGFESSVVFSEESRDPRRTVRMATYLAVALIALLYAFSSWALSVATGPGHVVGDSQKQGTDLLFNLAQTQLGGIIVEIGRVLFVTSLLAAMISFHNTTARYMFALGRERVLPAALGKTSMRTGAPKVGSAMQSIIGLIVIVVYAVGGWDPLVNLFYWGGTIGGFGVLILIAATSIAVVVFFARTPSGENIWRRVIAPVVAALAVLSVLGLAVLNFADMLGVPETSPLRWGVPLAYLLIGLLAIGYGLSLRQTRPQVYATIGLGAKSASSGGLGLTTETGEVPVVRP